MDLPGQGMLATAVIYQASMDKYISWGTAGCAASTNWWCVLLDPHALCPLIESWRQHDENEAKLQDKVHYEQGYMRFGGLFVALEARLDWID
jgi:hypothetical protein